MNKIEHRLKTLELMKDNSILILYSGVPMHTNQDDYYPFEENSHYFWLTGSQRDHQAIVLMKTNGETSEYLFIEEPDPFNERWTGKMPTTEEMAELTGMDPDSILYTSQMPSFLSRQMDMHCFEDAYFDTFRNDPEDMDDYNVLKAKQFSETYPHVTLHNLRYLTGKLRREKDEEEIADLRRAIAVTDNALKDMLAGLKPGMKEYQAQVLFESSCRNQGTTRFSFPTIAGAGKNACSMHYMTNRDEIHDGDLILFDLGAKYNNYCADISRTYPANGKYTDRQRAVYNVVLKANRAVKDAAKPGTTLRQLNDIAKDVLGQGLIDLGLIEDIEDVGQYYMHSVSHFIGIDCHDVMVEDAVLRPGAVISDEPGLYIDEEATGIRIEDDLLITEDGCECLSEGVMRDPDEIEAFMKEHHKH
jgi:Xaa-Pro aminopeptidase